MVSPALTALQPICFELQFAFALTVRALALAIALAGWTGTAGDEAGILAGTVAVRALDNAFAFAGGAGG